MATLFEHHDVLRSQFYQCNGVWQQACVENIIQPIEIITVDLSSLPKTEHEQALENEAERWQQSLNLNQGLLYRLIWFTFGAQEDSKLLLIIHHLVIDGVSWRILLEDFNLLYQQLSAGINTPLTKKTTSFKQWSEQLTAYAQTQTALQNIAYWLETDWSQITPLPTDLAAGENTQASIQNISVVLDAAKTKALLQGATLAYHCAFGDLLLTAVATALGQWLQSEDLLLELETHGREALFDELEVSRTVGWFTSIFPMRLHVSQQATFYENAANIHKQLKVLKNNGLDYSIVRYLGVDTQAVTQLQAIPDPQIGFNYLGRLDQGTQVDGLFTLSQQASGRQNSPTGKRPHLLDIDAYIVAEQLHIHWHYSVNYHHQETIAKVAKQCAKSLEQASAYCLTFEKLYQNLPSAQNIDVNNPIETPSHNLTEDAILNATITPKNCADLAQQPPRNILLTGATGFVGAFLLDELLRYTEATIFCLVRANDEQAALARIKTTLAGYKIQNPTLENRIIPLCGDLGKPLFGLSTVQFEYLSQVVDLIYHNAAFTHLVLPYQAVKPANVSGVSSILQLACTYKIKPVQYISTLSVFDDGSKPLSAEGFAENSLPSLSSRLKMGYSQSKLVAEHLLQQASARDLPVTIYRLGTITSHSSSGAWNRRDFHCSFLKVCIELGLFPDNKTLLALTPVDFISRSIVKLANLPVAIGQTYHVFNPQLTQTQAMLSWLAEFGYPLKTVPVAQWFAAFCEVVESHPAHPLYPLVDEIKGFIHTENTLMPYQHKQTAIALEFVGVDYPQVDKALFTQALNYLTEIGFFTEPVVHYATV
jgi:thioester reductase-like protein/non-ribosomal peptide synthase protein (TIGR01720 family)